MIYLQMSHSKFNCNWYPEDTLCTTIKGQLEIEGDILRVAICSYSMHNKPSLCTFFCTLVQALRLCRGCTAHRGSRGIALPFLDHGTRRG